MYQTTAGWHNGAPMRKPYILTGPSKNQTVSSSLGLVRYGNLRDLSRSYGCPLEISKNRRHLDVKSPFGDHLAIDLRQDQYRHNKVP
jgi:hypothetical protein